MKIAYKSLFLSLLGILFWVDEFDWEQRLSFMVGGIIGYLIILLLLTVRKKESKKINNEAILI